MKLAILGSKYDLSLVFAGDKRTASLNRQYRNKTYIPNVLSFPLDEMHGEIFLNIKQIARESKKNQQTPLERTALCFIHGLLHLKGLPHGSTMEKQETQMLQKFGYSKRTI